MRTFWVGVGHFVGPQNNGIVNQGQGSGWTVRYNTIQKNPATNGGAIGFMLGDNNVVSYNCFTGNGQTGISSVGNVIELDEAVDDIEEGEVEVQGALSPERHATPA